MTVGTLQPGLKIYIFFILIGIMPGMALCWKSKHSSRRKAAGVDDKLILLYLALSFVHEKYERLAFITKKHSSASYLINNFTSMNCIHTM